MRNSSHKNLVWRVLVERERRSVADRKEMVNDPTQRTIWARSNFDT
jgi:hypothetical protein